MIDDEDEFEPIHNEDEYNPVHDAKMRDQLEASMVVWRKAQIEKFRKEIICEAVIDNGPKIPNHMAIIKDLCDVPSAD